MHPRPPPPPLAPLPATAPSPATQSGKRGPRQARAPPSQPPPQDNERQRKEPQHKQKTIDIDKEGPKISNGEEGRPQRQVHVDWRPWLLARRDLDGGGYGCEGPEHWGCGRDCHHMIENIMAVLTICFAISETTSMTRFVEGEKVETGGERESDFLHVVNVHRALWSLTSEAHRRWCLKFYHFPFSASWIQASIPSYSKNLGIILKGSTLLLKTPKKKKTQS